MTPDGGPKAGGRARAQTAGGVVQAEGPEGILNLNERGLNWAKRRAPPMLPRAVYNNRCRIVVYQTTRFRT
jgi:hypothetical protein